MTVSLVERRKQAEAQQLCCSDTPSHAAWRARQRPSRARANSPGHRTCALISYEPAAGPG